MNRHILWSLGLGLLALATSGCGNDPEVAPARSAPVIAEAPPGDEAESFLASKERWAIKTGADPSAASITLGSAERTRIADLIKVDRPAELPELASTREARTHRYGRPEVTLYEIDADILRYKLESDDHDIHIVIRDHGDAGAEDAPADSGARRTMVAELPDPSVVIETSPFHPGIQTARAEFLTRCSPGIRFTYGVRHVRLRGVGFFDFLHGQSGCAANGIELHPILSIEFLDDGMRKREQMAPGNSQNGASANRGDVWVNLNSGVFWRPGTTYYGNTRRGEYMTEDAAMKAGYRAAGER